MLETIPTRFGVGEKTGMATEDLEFSEFVRAKAKRFIEGDRVVRVLGERDLWRVAGDHGSYLVRYDRHFEETGRVGFLVCTCPLSEHSGSFLSYCSHALAVLTLAAPKSGESA